MKIKKGYVLHCVDNVNIVLADESKPAHDGIITLNNTGAFLWRLLETNSLPKALADGLMAEYGIDADTAMADVNDFLQKLLDAGIIEE